MTGRRAPSDMMPGARPLDWAVLAVAIVGVFATLALIGAPPVRGWLATPPAGSTPAAPTLTATAHFTNTPIMESVPPTVQEVKPDTSFEPLPERSYWRWKASHPDRIIPFGDFYLALRVLRGWPEDQALAMTDAAINCEAPAYNIGTSGPIQGDVIGVNLASRVFDGDGITVGPGIHLPAHPGIEQRHDLATLAGTVDALTEIRDEAVGYGWAPLSPWSCIR